MDGRERRGARPGTPRQDDEGWRASPLRRIFGTDTKAFDSKATRFARRKAREGFV
jgi:hypothetical protein